MSDIVIGVCGKAGAGKDTVGDMIARDYHMNSDSLAAPLKRAVCDIFGVDEYDMNDREFREKELGDWPGHTPRKLLQVIGTDLFRERLQADVWIRSFLLRMHGSVVVTDIRFPDEMHRIKERMGDNCLFIKVLRDSPDGAPGGVEGHVSESYDLECDINLDNNGTLDELHEKIRYVLDPYFAMKAAEDWNCTHPRPFVVPSDSGLDTCGLCGQRVSSVFRRMEDHSALWSKTILEGIGAEVPSL